jgi:hypothetical protein
MIFIGFFMSVILYPQMYPQTVFGMIPLDWCRILHDNDFESGWIELQLAHVDKNTVRGTYNHAQYLSQRQVVFAVVCRLFRGA